MFRRVIAPALIAVGVWLGAMVIDACLAGLDRWTIGSVSSGSGPWMLPVLPTLDWLILVGVFLTVHLCGTRGGTKRECLLVGIAPLIVGGIFLLVTLLLLVGVNLLDLALGYAPTIPRHKLTVSTALITRQLLRQILGLACTCFAATWLYFFTARRMRERPFWLAAEE